jgi:hypothetical protein
MPAASHFLAGRSERSPRYAEKIAATPRRVISRFWSSKVPSRWRVAASRRAPR